MESYFLHSSFREKTLEHVFIGECLRRLWAKGVWEAEVLKAEVDAAGYDLVMEVGGVLRHIQLKTSFNGSAVREQTINAKLADKPSGCVVWIGFDPDTIELGPFYWFGGLPGEPLPSISSRGGFCAWANQVLAPKTELLCDEDGVSSLKIPMRMPVARIRRMNRTRFRAVLLKRQVSSGSMIIVEIR